MKNTAFILSLFVALVTLSFTIQTGPEPIVSITVVDKPFSYYENQVKLWKEVTEETPQNADAWWNLFMAARYSNMKSPDKALQQDLGKIMQKMGKAIPSSFEKNYLQYVYEGRSQQSFEHLLKARDIAPKHPKILHSMILYNVVQGNKDGLREYVQELFDSKDYSPGALKWNYNMLQSVEQNAVLLTWGDNDTYPAWILQNTQNERTDVEVINIALLTGFDDYRAKVLERLDIPPFTETLANVGNSDDFQVKLIRHLLNNARQPMYFAPSVRPLIRDKFDSDLYLTGLALKYSKKSFDNIAILKNNYENKFLKDYLTISFEQETSEKIVHQMNLNYLPSMLRLYSHYKDAGEHGKAADLKSIIKTVAKKGGQEENVSAYLGDGSTKKPINSSLVIKELDRDYGKVKGNLYAATTETTNKAYEGFLMDLLKHKKYEKLQQAQIGKTDWRALLPAKYANVSDGQLFGHGHPDQPEMPVQNISYEAAQLYCQWITQVYNQSNDKKKKYKKVLFRLPTQAEWEMAARGNKSNQQNGFPYGGTHVTNAKGCFLFNASFYDLKEGDKFLYPGVDPCENCHETIVQSLDGGFFHVIADAYFPNDFGLYNMSGNLAEMIDQPGIAMGGSWADTAENCQVTSQQEYSKASPKIGFRVFMEVKEYKD